MADGGQVETTVKDVGKLEAAHALAAAAAGKLQAELARTEDECAAAKVALVESTKASESKAREVELQRAEYAERLYMVQVRIAHHGADRSGTGRQLLTIQSFGYSAQRAEGKALYTGMVQGYQRLVRRGNTRENVLNLLGSRNPDLGAQ